MGRCLASNIKDLPVAAIAVEVDKWERVFIKQVHLPHWPLHTAEMMSSLNP